MAAALREAEEDRNRFRQDTEDAKAALQSLQVQTLTTCGDDFVGSLHPCMSSTVSASDDELRECHVCLAEARAGSNACNNAGAVGR